MRWFKVHTDILDNLKISKIGDKTFRFFLKLLAFSAELEKNGAIFVAISDLKYRFRVTEKQIFRELKSLSDVNLISFNLDGVNVDIQITNWKKRQYCESMERTRRYREKKRHGDVTVTVTKPSPPPRARENRDRDRDRDRTEVPPLPPTGGATKKKSKPKTEKTEIPFLESFPEDFQKDENFRSAWKDWIQNRRDIGKPLKMTAAKLQSKTLIELGKETGIQWLKYSAANGYQGLFAPKGGQTPKPQTLIRQASERLEDRYKNFAGKGKS